LLFWLPVPWLPASRVPGTPTRPSGSRAVHFFFFQELYPTVL